MIQFGARANHCQIDHLIPQSILNPDLPGGAEGELLTNFAPILTKTNVKQLNVQCSHKLSEVGPYAVEVQTGAAHPFGVWLTAQQGRLSSELDDQERLQIVYGGLVGAPRLKWIAERLAQRL